MSSLALGAVDTRDIDVPNSISALVITIGLVTVDHGISLL